MEQETKQLKSLENPIKSGKAVARNPDGTFMKGHKKIGGMELGFKSFKVLMDETVKEIAKMNDKPEAEIWKVLTRVGYSEAKDGNYLFYRDILDRYYGKPVETFRGDPNSPLIVQISKEVAEKNDINPSTKDNSDRPA